MSSAGMFTSAFFGSPCCSQSRELAFPCLHRDVPAGSQSYDPLTSSPANPALLQETVIMTHDQLGLDHLNSIHCHADDNQQRCAPKIEIHAKSLRHPLRQNRIQPGPDERNVLD